MRKGWSSEVEVAKSLQCDEVFMHANKLSSNDVRTILVYSWILQPVKLIVLLDTVTGWTVHSQFVHLTLQSEVEEDL